jgi:hypothetical protein
MVNDPESDELICWAEDGASFFVNRQEDFARKVLPRFFKHNKFSSFVRQLNMYGFHKVPHLQQGVLEADGDSERWEFSNPHFQRNQPDLLLLVTRKKGPNADDKEIANIDLHHILDEIQTIKKHQMNISTQLQTIQRDNQVLWQETVAARERHLRHQETIDKILRFLASVFSSGDKRPAIPRKRRFLLGPAAADEHDEYTPEDEEHQHQEEERAKKIPRQQSAGSSSNSFNIDDYVTGKDDLTHLSTNLPDHLKHAASTASELHDAIALHDQSKHGKLTTIFFNGKKIYTDPCAIDDTNTSAITSSLATDFNANIPHIQNLQNLIMLAQSSPDLLSQLTNDAFYGSPAQQTPVPTTTTTAATASSLSSSSPATPSSITLPNQSHSLENVTNSISSIASSADALNQDIDDLGISLQTLAQHLGFDPTKISNSEDDPIKIEDEGDLLDMDEFLNTYGKFA